MKQILTVEIKNSRSETVYSVDLEVFDDKIDEVVSLIDGFLDDQAEEVG
jgi:hypothetical protein